MYVFMFVYFQYQKLSHFSLVCLPFTAFVCMIAEISTIIKTIDIKFGVKVSVYRTQLKLA